MLSGKLSVFLGLEKHVLVTRNFNNLNRTRRNIRDQRARQQVAVAVLLRPGQHHLVGGGQPALRDAAVERERGLGRSLGNAGLPLQRDRQEGMRARLERPVFLGEPAHPQAVELHAGGLEHADHLHRRASGDSGWNSVSEQMRRSCRRASREEIFPGSAPSRANSPSCSSNLARVWNSSESSVRSPGKPAACSSAVKCCAQAWGDWLSFFCALAKRSSRRARSSGQGPARARTFPSETRAPSSLRSRASSCARASISCSAPPRNGERTRRLTSSNAFSPNANSRMPKAAATSG